MVLIPEKVVLPLFWDLYSSCLFRAPRSLPASEGALWAKRAARGGPEKGSARRPSDSLRVPRGALKRAPSHPAPTLRRLQEPLVCCGLRLKLLIGRTETLGSLSYLELYQRLYDQKGNKILYEADGTLTSSKLDDQSLYNILLLVALVMSFAVDTSICERGFALMNNLKTARRSRMGNLLLRTLMTICELGKDWADPFKIPVDEIALELRHSRIIDLQLCNIFY